MAPEIKSSSPSGRYVLRTHPWEARMSHWIETPELIDSLTGQRLVHFVDSGWSLESAAWGSDTEVTMTLRKYPGDHVPPLFEVTVNCQDGTARVGSQACEPSSLERVLARAYAAGRRKA